MSQPTRRPEQAEPTGSSDPASTAALPPAGGHRRAVASAPFSPMSFEEEMVRLHQQIEAVLPDRPFKAVQFIGSRDGEGTTSVAREFARTSATRFGRRVLLLEFGTDRTADVFPGENAPVAIGDTTLFAGVLPRQLIVHTTDGGSPGASEPWTRMRQSYDLVVIDSPPASRTPDGLALVSQVDGVVLVLEAESTRWPVAAHAKDTIERSGGRVLGVVLNKRRHYIPAFVYDWL